MKSLAFLPALLLLTGCPADWKVTDETHPVTGVRTLTAEGPEWSNSHWQQASLSCEPGGTIHQNNIFFYETHLRVDTMEPRYTGDKGERDTAAFRAAVYQDMVRGDTLLRTGPWDGVKKLPLSGFAEAFRQLALHCETDPAWLGPPLPEEAQTLSASAPPEIRKAVGGVRNREAVLACAANEKTRPDLDGAERRLKAVRICAKRQKRQEQNAIRFQEERAAKAETEAEKERMAQEDRDLYQAWRKAP